MLDYCIIQKSHTEMCTRITKVTVDIFEFYINFQSYHTSHLTYYSVPKQVDL